MHNNGDKVLIKSVVKYDFMTGDAKVIRKGKPLRESSFDGKHRKNILDKTFE